MSPKKKGPEDGRIRSTRIQSDPKWTWTKMDPAKHETRFWSLVLGTKRTFGKPQGREVKGSSTGRRVGRLIPALNEQNFAKTLNLKMKCHGTRWLNPKPGMATKTCWKHRCFFIHSITRHQRAGINYKNGDEEREIPPITTISCLRPNPTPAISATISTAVNKTSNNYQHLYGDAR